MSDTVSTVYRDDRDQSGLVAGVVSAIADLEGVDPEHLDLCLADSIDGDALEGLYARTAGDADLTVRFTVEEYEVYVPRPDEIHVSRPRDAGREPSGA
ncbi:MAG: HalOD1 output domain-containing protein [Halosimplex sp.]